MTDRAAPFQPGRVPTRILFRSRSEFAGFKAFGSGHGAVLMDLGIERRLRSAAEIAAQQRRVAGGLLFGHGWTDDQGGYLVIDDFLEAEPAGDSGNPAAAGGAGQLTLPEDGLRVLARRYPASLEVGWWRTRATLGEFSPRDFMTQAELVGPDGVGLLVYGSGVHWGTAYLGPDGHAPDAAGTLALATDDLPGPAPGQEPAGRPGPELVDITAGEHLSQEPIPLADDVNAVKWTGLTAAAAGKPLRQQVNRRSSRRTRRRAPAPPERPAPPVRRVPPERRVPSRARVPLWGLAQAPVEAVRGAPGPPVPEDVRLVAIAIAVAVVLAAIIVGILLHSLIATLAIAAIVLLVIFSSAWLSRR